ncbi:hypothetical protein PHYPSEUDO_001484 [Phytophthora pseudosyringae]|uniref:Serine-threonine/tyrosine-protein kinase catalytic domain-containing protein n=1 Tax=Phytophthora pseudosyringae TaxID=221518 RepID=A0A8T1VYU4_9STRA|nr:hypothetical protein PHYPSEUDO_001484 [Phytophthora pseudosyringae]
MNAQGRNALHEAAANAALDTIEFLLNLGVDLHQADTFGMTPVLDACRRGFLDTLKHLLAAGGVDINDANLAGQTALHLSAQDCHTEVVELLLDLGADVHQSEKRGWTPLHSAAAEGHASVVELLVVNGAQLDAETLSGETAEDLARKRGYEAVINYLRDLDAEDATLERLTSAELDLFEEYLLDPDEVCFDANEAKVDDTSNGSWLDAPIAVKLRKRDRITKYFVEALSEWSRLNHPHIVKLYGFCHSEEEPYFVYERAIHQSLSEYQQSGDSHHALGYLGKAVSSSSGAAVLT